MHIIEARNLAGRDRSGTSDPAVFVKAFGPPSNPNPKPSPKPKPKPKPNPKPKPKPKPKPNPKPNPNPNREPNPRPNPGQAFGQQQRTSSKEKDNAPVWDEHLFFEGRDLSLDALNKVRG